MGEEEGELINADEFEEIAEIYDSIRLLHSKINPERDSALAEDFDNRLKVIMENLSQYVNSPNISIVFKKKSLWRVSLISMQSVLRRSVTTSISVQPTSLGRSMCVELFQLSLKVSGILWRLIQITIHKRWLRMMTWRPI